MGQHKSLAYSNRSGAKPHALSLVWFKSGVALLALATLVLLAGCASGSTPTSVTLATHSTSTVSTTTTASAVLWPAPTSGDIGSNWGYVNAQGSWAISAKFQAANQFSEGLAAIMTSGTWGYINTKGELTVRPQYLEANHFHDGLARVATKQDPTADNGVTGYGWIDKTGKFVIAANWYDAGDFSEGLAPVQRGKLCGFINEKGDIAIPLKFQSVGSFSEGLALAMAKGVWGYIDKTGAWVIKPQFKAPSGVFGIIHADSIARGAGRFKDGLAPIGSHYESEAAYFIDKTGKKVFNRTFEGAGEFSEGLAAVDVNGKWGFIDTSGHMVIQPLLNQLRYDWYLEDGHGFNQGLVGASHDSGTIGYIDRTGKYVIQPQFYGNFGFFPDGLAYVYLDADWTRLGVIGKTGKVIYPTKVTGQK